MDTDFYIVRVKNNGIFAYYAGNMRFTRRIEMAKKLKKYNAEFVANTQNNCYEPTVLLYKEAIIQQENV